MRAGPCADRILLRRDGLVAGQIDDQGDGIQCKADEVHRAQEKTTTIASQMITHRLVVPGARHRMDMMKLTMPIISTSSA